MYKEAKCKYCGGRHFAYQCWRKPKKSVVKRIESRSKADLGVKRYKVSSNDKNERQRLIGALDRVFSEYIRQRDADKDGFCVCYTCGKRGPWRTFDNGHWQSRRFMATRWDELNCHSQEKICNRQLNGNYAVYNKKMLAELGQDGYQKLWEKAHSGKKYSTVELRELLEYWEKRLRELVCERKT